MAFNPKYGQVKVEKKSIPDDEPVFLLRAQDSLASQAVRHYAELRRRHGDEEGAAHCEAVARMMEAWPDKKMPD